MNARIGAWCLVFLFLTGVRAGTPESERSEMAGPDDEQTFLVKNAFDYLGQPTSIRFTGTSEPGIGAGAAPPPAPASPGGMAGFGGGGRPGAGGAGGLSLGGITSLAGRIKQLIESTGGTGVGTRGDIGGEGTPQTSSTSTSDQLRSQTDALSTALNLTPAELASLQSAGLNLPAVQGLAGANVDEMAQLFKNAAPGEAVQTGPGTFATSGAPEGGAGILGAGIDIPGIGTVPYLAIASALLNIGMTAAGPGSTEDKAIAATEDAVKLAATAAAPATFGASLAVYNILDFINRMRAGQGFGQSIVSANDPTAMLDAEGKGLSYGIFNPSSEWLSFPQRLMAGESQQGTALATLAQALPYVQSKEELGQLLNSYKNYVTTTTGDPLTGGAEGIYNVQTIPGSGTTTHGFDTPAVDWAQPTQQLQTMIDRLRAVLPGEEITAQYGQPGGGLEGDVGMRLWTQFLPRDQNAPLYLPRDIAAGIIPGAGGDHSADINTPALPKGFYDVGTLAAAGGEAWNSALGYGMPGYDYAGAGFPAPGQYVGQVSPYWQQLAAQEQAQAQQRAALASGALGSIGNGGAPGMFAAEALGGAPTGYLSDDQKRLLGLL